MIVVFLLVVPVAAALLVVLAGASLLTVLGPITAVALVALVVVWIADAGDRRRPLPRIVQPRVPPLPDPVPDVRPWHHTPPTPAEPPGRSVGRHRNPNPAPNPGVSHGGSDRAA